MTAIDREALIDRAAGPSPLQMIRRDRPVTSATVSVPKCWMI